MEKYTYQKAEKAAEGIRNRALELTNGAEPQNDDYKNAETQILKEKIVETISKESEGREHDTLYYIGEIAKVNNNDKLNEIKKIYQNFVIADLAQQLAESIDKFDGKIGNIVKTDNKSEELGGTIGHWPKHMFLSVVGGLDNGLNELVGKQRDLIYSFCDYLAQLDVDCGNYFRASYEYETLGNTELANKYRAMKNDQNLEMVFIPPVPNDYVDRYQKILKNISEIAKTLIVSDNEKSKMRSEIDKIIAEM